MYEGIDRRTSINPTSKTEVPLEWRTVDYKNFGGHPGSPMKIIIQCNGKEHKRVVFNDETGTSEVSGESWPCDPAEHNPLTNK